MLVNGDQFSSQKYITFSSWPLLTSLFLAWLYFYEKSFAFFVLLVLQILSMRNGVNLHTMYMSGALEPLQTCQMSIGFGLDGDPAMNIGSMNIGSAALPLSQDLSAQTSLDMPNRCASSHPPTLTTPGLVDVANSQAPLVNSMQSHLGSFQMPVACEVIFSLTPKKKEASIIMEP